MAGAYRSKAMDGVNHEVLCKKFNVRNEQDTLGNKVNHSDEDVEAVFPACHETDVLQPRKEPFSSAFEWWRRPHAPWSRAALWCARLRCPRVRCSDGRNHGRSRIEQNLLSIGCVLQRLCNQRFNLISNCRIRLTRTTGDYLSTPITLGVRRHIAPVMFNTRAISLQDVYSF
jgi:hypothetical protein